MGKIRGNHVAPGTYSEFNDISYEAKTIGITTAGLAGETLMGPAFDPTFVTKWEDYTNKFGGTSPEKFDESQYPYVEKIQISTFDGLVVDLSVYSNYEEYWLKIDISTTRLPSYKIKDYVETNSFLFKNWWFKLPQDEGKILFIFKF